MKFIFEQKLSLQSGFIIFHCGSRLRREIQLGETLNSILPKIKDRDHYRDIFKENHHWERAIHFLKDKYLLNGKVVRGELGSHIVYRVGNSWIKLMAPIFAKDMPFEISGLKSVENRLGVSTPHIIAEGTLDDWAYVILSHIEGQAIRHVWSALSEEYKQDLTDQMAKIVVQISQCPVDEIVANRFQWNQFIETQYNELEIHQRRKGLPESWLRLAPEFLKKFPMDEFQTNKTVFLHADLTYDHFLVSAGDPPKITGVIDMADCQIGHFEYELVAPCIFIFKGQPQLLRRFLVGCGYSESSLNQNFSEKLLAWALLHRYFSFISYFQHEMDEIQAGGFSSLASKVFPLG